MGQKKRVLLLFPPFKEGFVMGKVPLGLAYIAASLKQNGHDVEAYNLVVDSIDHLDLNDFDFCGITVLTAFITHTRGLVEELKAKNPKLQIVLGGPHPSMKVKHSLTEISPLVDFVIAGEGEKSMVNLIEASNPRSGDIPGVFFMEDGSLKGKPNSQTTNLDELPYPDQRIFDHGNLEKRNPFRSFLCSRGCPFGCFNCQPYLKEVFSFRMRSPENVIQEMKMLNQEYGQTYFGLVDSEFPINKKWFLKFTELKEEWGLEEFSFHCNAFSKLIDEDIINGYKKLNVTRLAIGVESGNQHVVDNVLNKRINLEYTKKVFEMTAAQNLNTHAYFMIGIPGESLDNMRETLDYALNLQVTSLEFNILTPGPALAFMTCVKKRAGSIKVKNTRIITKNAWA